MDDAGLVTARSVPNGERLTACLLTACAHPRVHRNKLDGPYDNRVMPIVLSCTLIVALCITFAGTIIAYENDAPA